MKKYLYASLLGAIAFLPQSTFATQATCSGVIGCVTGASANLTLNVIIPPYIRFQLGDATLAPSITFDYSSVPGSVGDSVTTGATGGANTALGGGLAALGALEVSLQSNTGGATGVSITVSLAGTGIVVGPDTTRPVWSDFTVATSGTNIVHPGLVSGATTTFTGSAVRNLTDTWTFTYANTKILTDGTYSGTVTYTAATF